ncbi:hypothetical protein [Nocardia sp. NPDC052566]|uniref:hypothetical protein n=1 Tax=Nocardia sp. NPDC052566 TaxID=3364330 RepID=UPI0037C9CC98
MTPTSETNQNGWCLRCGYSYDDSFTPGCECAGDPPIGYYDNPLDPAHRKHLGRVIRMRCKPKGDTRIAEAEFRAKAPRHLSGIEVLEITRFDGGSFDTHTYAHAAVLTRRGENYSTHLLIYRDDHADFLLERGHYDYLTRSAAEDDARRRNL